MALLRPFDGIHWYNTKKGAGAVPIGRNRAYAVLFGFRLLYFPSTYTFCAETAYVPKIEQT